MLGRLVCETDVVNKEMYSFEDARGDLFQVRERIRSYVLSDPSSLCRSLRQRWNIYRTIKSLG